MEMHFLLFSRPAEVLTVKFWGQSEIRSFSPWQTKKSCTSWLNTAHQLGAMHTALGSDQSLAMHTRGSFKIWRTFWGVAHEPELCGGVVSQLTHGPGELC